MKTRLVAVMAASLLTWGAVAATASATVFVTLLAAINPPGALAAAELSVTKDGPATGTRGVPFKYEITVVNSNATDPATETEVYDNLPAGLTFNPVGSDPDCTLDTSTDDPNDVRCVVGEGGVLLGADTGFNSDTLEIDVTPTVAGLYENTASVASNGTESQDSNRVTTEVTDAGSGGADPGAGGTSSSGSTTPTGNAVTPTATPPSTPPRVDVRSPRLASDTGRTGHFRISVRNRGAASSSSASRYELQIREPGARASRTRRARMSADDLSFVFRGKPGRTYVIRARAINAQGRKGRFGESRTVVPVDDGRFTRRTLRYSGRWKEPRNGTAYGGRLSQSSRRGARVSYRFRGDRLFVVGRRSRRGGKALVVLNGRRRVVSFYGRRTLDRRVIATLRGKSRGINKFRIVNLGTKGARNGKGTRVELDALGARRLH